jgi:hypothetical protein
MNNTQKIELLKHTIEELRNDIEKIKRVYIFYFYLIEIKYLFK